MGTSGAQGAAGANGEPGEEGLPGEPGFDAAVSLLKLYATQIAMHQLSSYLCGFKSC